MQRPPNLLPRGGGTPSWTLCFQPWRPSNSTALGHPIGYPDNFGRAGESAAVLAGPVPGRALPGGHDGLGVHQAGSVLLL